MGGSIPDLDPESRNHYNTTLVFGRDGELLRTHRKAYLFDIDIEGQMSFRESDILSPGNRATPPWSIYRTTA